MPALVTHDDFGRNAYELIREEVGHSRECIDAFLLGNQGPDPLFYAIMDPAVADWADLGTRLHRESTNEVLAGFVSSLTIIPKSDLPVARAYALGFLCHYLLDSTVHPLVYAQQYALCDAGVSGLTRKQGDAVHQTIECEFDEVVLSRHLNTTLADFNPARDILKGHGNTLKTISTMYLYTSLVVFNQVPPSQLFTRSVKLYRGVETLLYSRSGIKRRMLVKAEEALRSVSTIGTLSMRARPREESIFENNAHDQWMDPGTGQVRTECFENLYEQAMWRVRDCAELMCAPHFDAKVAEDITRGLNFNGVPIGGALITVNED